MTTATVPAAQDFKFAPVTLEAAEALSNASPEEVARFDEAMMGVTGGDQKSLDAYKAELRALLVKTATRPGEPLAGTETGQVSSTADTTAGGADAALSSEQRAAVAANLRKFWTGDKEALEAHLRAEGIEAEKPIDERGKLNRQIDASLQGLRPDQYRLNAAFVGKGFDDATAMQLSGDLRNLFAGMQLPGGAAGTVAEELLSNIADARQSKMDPEAFKLWWRGEEHRAASLMRMDLEQVAELARATIGRIDVKTAKALTDRGAFNSAEALVRLVQAELLRRARG